MIGYIIKRLIYMVLTLVMVSIVAFVIINLPPGSFIETYAAQLEASGSPATTAQLQFLTERYGLDQPMWRQYLNWIVPLVTRGDYGFSFEWQLPVWDLISERLLLTIVVSLVAMIFVYAVSIPVALYSATHQYSAGDYAVTFLGIIGLAVPNFLLALILLVASSALFGVTPTGLFSPDYMNASWSWDKFLDLLVHLPVPVIVVGLSGTAATIRVLRSQLLDEFQKQYVVTARAKGVPERRLLYKYPFRVALNPIISTVGHLLPDIVSGSTIVAIVLGLPTIGPLLLRAIVAQDTFVSASCLLLLGVLTVVGVVISDILLTLLDPRVRMSRAN
ncbi:MAG: ABC transporter permease [Rhodobacteraceae bacterium]|jgi:peptide/nickel transport system permease protein|nr:ABC transporter permease [Paracoccaceae bacterium]